MTRPPQIANRKIVISSIVLSRAASLSAGSCHGTPLSCHDDDEFTVIPSGGIPYIRMARALIFRFLLLAAVPCGIWARNPLSPALDPKYLYVGAGNAGVLAIGGNLSDAKGKDAVIVGARDTFSTPLPLTPSLEPYTLIVAYDQSAFFKGDLNRCLPPPPCPQFMRT